LAPRGDHFDQYISKEGNVSVSDPYRFMEDVESNQTKKWVEAEATLTKDFF
jgi:hypothetical protein